MQALSYQNDTINIKEPFKGLFTQGMVCHETYKDQDNNWVNPEEIETIGGKKFLKNDNNKEIIVGPSESMSKSKKNTIDPERIIKNFGADSVRLFILSDSPPEKDVQWSDEGMKSSFKFIQKLWILHQKIIEQIELDHPSNSTTDLEIITNQFIKNVTINIENFSYNKIVANFHETYSALNKIIFDKIEKKKLIENYKKILSVMSPVIPHFANECMKMLDIEENEIYWPKTNETYLTKNTIKFIVQINGKTRKIIDSEKNISEEELLLKIQTDVKLNNYLKTGSIQKKIFIPNKLINIIIA
jgi:leucyl-tRNA synthetase